MPQIVYSLKQFRQFTSEIYIQMATQQGAEQNLKVQHRRARAILETSAPPKTLFVEFNAYNSMVQPISAAVKQYRIVLLKKYQELISQEMYNAFQTILKYALRIQIVNLINVSKWRSLLNKDASLQPPQPVMPEALLQQLEQQSNARKTLDRSVLLKDLT
ncbi:Hypothetical_protein [Hexamita inflata]|uniref:Hypothetical_protein n=1 Tax=Hexamita inflata TaxID=28002 RepID=A0AA86N7Y7_9EUKA|nr:Hypothetical protein HINF_LOCUS2180 [Hexamita inflata]